jgi:hypothetical protein
VEDGDVAFVDAGLPAGCRTLEPVLAQANRVLGDLVAVVSAVDASVIGFGHGEPWTHGVSAALDRAYAAEIS